MSALFAMPAFGSVVPSAAPDEFRAIYLSYWSAATPSRMEGVVEMAREGLINSVVIDVKDVTGHVGFDTRVARAEKIGAKRVVIRDLEKLVDRLQAEGLYVIGRVVVFSDPKLAEARPELGVHSKAKLGESTEELQVDTLWRDRRKLAWIDPSAIDAWDYNIT
ncbi:MAG: hypothetical protein GY953_38290, partial [bacterium]|nr:hypothetical protein [bacterium]